MNSRTRLSFALLTCCAFLYGCSSSSSSDDEEIPPNDVVEEVEEEELAPVLMTGILAPTAVSGVTFATATQLGETNAAGEFQYFEGETIVFSIGDLDFPAVAAQAVVSPLDMGAGTTDAVVTATNITRLLQTLDSDGYPYDGIDVPSAAAASSSPINFGVSAANFEINLNVINLVSNTGSVNNTLTSLQDASVQLFQITTLEDFEDSVVDQRLVLRREGGIRNENTQFEFRSDGSLVRITTDGSVDQDVDLVWFWDDQFLCQQGSVDGVSRPLECQVASLIADGLLSLVEERGRGEAVNWFIE